MKKKLVLSSLVVGLSLFSSFYSSEEAVATNDFDIPTLEKVNSMDPISAIFRNDLLSLSNNLNQNAYLNGDIDVSELFRFTNNTLADLKSAPFVRLNDDMVLQDGTTLAAHNAQLTNLTDTDQKMSTASFSYTSTDSVSTTTTHATGISMTTKAEMKFPFISGGMSMTVGYDFSHNNAVKSEVKKEWAVPSQSFTIPAGRSFNVNWVLDKGVATGTTNLTSAVGGLVPYKQMGANGPLFPMEVGKAVSEQNRLVTALPSTQFKWSESDNWESINGEIALRKWGTSRYRAEGGTRLRMIITDAHSHSSPPVVIQESIMDVTPKVVQ